MTHDPRCGTDMISVRWLTNEARVAIKLTSISYEVTDTIQYVSPKNHNVDPGPERYHLVPGFDFLCAPPLS